MNRRLMKLSFIVTKSNLLVFFIGVRKFCCLFERFDDVQTEVFLYLNKANFQCLAENFVYFAYIFSPKGSY